MTLRAGSSCTVSHHCELWLIGQLSPTANYNSGRGWMRGGGGRGGRTDASRHANSRESQNKKFRKFFFLIFKFLTLL
jgi:hypothetical protein